MSQVYSPQRPQTTPTPSAEPVSRAKSYGFGVFLVLLGIGLLIGFYFTQRAPAKLFDLMAGGGVAALLSGIGLFLHPLDDERLALFQNEGNPIAVFQAMPVFWKAWLLVVLAGMIGGFVYVSKTTVRVPRGVRIESFQE